MTQTSKQTDRQVRVSIQEAEGGMYTLYLTNRYGLLGSVIITEPEAKELSYELQIIILKRLKEHE